MRTKDLKNDISILAIVNYRNWPDASPSSKTKTSLSVWNLVHLDKLLDVEASALLCSDHDQFLHATCQPKLLTKIGFELMKSLGKLNDITAVFCKNATSTAA